MFYVYVLESLKTRRYYIGSTQDVNTRLFHRNSGYGKPTKSHRPWKLVRIDSFETISDAVKREKQLKSWKSRDYMEHQL